LVPIAVHFRPQPPNKKWEQPLGIVGIDNVFNSIRLSGQRGGSDFFQGSLDAVDGC
jgi:hypothetical protein